MKCDYCNKKLNPKNVAYYLGKKVHPGKCFEYTKWQHEHLSHEERMEVLRKNAWGKNAKNYSGEKQ